MLATLAPHVICLANHAGESSQREHSRNACIEHGRNAREKVNYE
jgi:hypothetical protein